MAKRKRRSPTEEVVSGELKRVKALELDTCSYTEAISLLFDPKRVLLLRVFFIDPEKTEYISVGF